MVQLDADDTGPAALVRVGHFPHLGPGRAEVASTLGPAGFVWLVRQVHGPGHVLPAASGAGTKLVRYSDYGETGCGRSDFSGGRAYRVITSRTAGTISVAQ